MTPVPPLVQISSVARDFCISRLEDVNTGFNYQMNLAAPNYSVSPFTLDHTVTPPTLLLGRYSYAVLKQAGILYFNAPFAVLSMAKSDMSGRQTLRVTPATFSGMMIASVDFYIPYAGAFAPDGEAMFHAVEDSFVNCFNSPPQSYAGMPSGLTYNNECIVEQGQMEWDGNRFVQLIPCSLFFYRVG